MDSKIYGAIKQLKENVIEYLHIIKDIKFRIALKILDSTEIDNLYDNLWLYNNIIRGHSHNHHQQHQPHRIHPLRNFF